ncbi:hypothetical protein [Piscinibacter sp.]|jgi:hypothetical protein|uniref:hypothetical protein n=1 Tax=Piscinibacter sp. TaxID=1903157 RepID=UPI00355A3C80
MPDEVFIYLIVALNAFAQVMLIRRLKFPAGGRWKYQLFAIGIPVVVMLSMRLLIASGAIHGHVADQSPTERLLTTAASALLLGGPWLVTLVAVLGRKRKGSDLPTSLK